MLIDKKTFDKAVSDNYNKWLADCKRLISPDTDTATDILNDMIVYTYNRLLCGNFECKNLDGYIYKGCLYSKISTQSPYQRKRGLQYDYVDIETLTYLY